MATDTKPSPMTQLPKAILLGGGRGGCAMLALLLEVELLQVVAVVDIDPAAAGLQRALEAGIAAYTDPLPAIAAHAPCIVFNLTHRQEFEKELAQLPGVERVVDGWEARLIWQMATRLQSARDELQHQATHDRLTGLYNRRFLDEQSIMLLAQANRYRTPVTLALIDIDHFKQVNDRFGHAIGDRVLQHLAFLLSNNMRRSDLFGRWGGEEFLAILPQCNSAAGLEALNLWLRLIRNSPLKHETATIPLAFSAGIATYDPDRMPAYASGEALLHHLLEQADHALYEAKTSGRARISVAVAEHTPSKPAGSL